jgi:hypothetical protein
MAEAVLVERGTGVLVLALQQSPEAVAHGLEATARRHHLPVHDLAEAGRDGVAGPAGAIVVGRKNPGTG